MVNGSLCFLAMRRNVSSLMQMSTSSLKARVNEAAVSEP